MPNVSRGVIALGFALVAATCGFAERASAQSADTGLHISVPSPITTQSCSAIKGRIDAAKAKPERRPTVIIFDFNPQDKDATTPDFGSSYELAALIADLHDINTVAYVHGKVSGHSVFPVLCCKQLLVGPKAVIGDVTGTKDEALPPRVGQGYANVIGQVHPSRVAIALKMLDANVKLRKAKKGPVDWFVDYREVQKFEKDGIRVTDTSQVQGGEDNKIGSFKADQLRSLGIAARQVESSRDVLDQFGLNPSVLKDDPLDGRPLVAFRYVLKGSIQTGVKETLDRVLQDIVKQKGNVLFLQLECAGGDLQAARELAEKLIEFENGENPILIVAFIPEKAPDTAAIIALGCSQIVMSKRTDAPKVGDDPPSESEIGDFSAALAKGGNVDFLVTSLRELAEKQGYPPQLIEGMLRADVEIVRVKKKGNATVRRLMTDREWQEEKAKGTNAEWDLEISVKPKGQLLKLSATQAEQYGLARHTVDKRDPAEVYARYGVEPSKVKDAEPSILDRFANFLKLPVVTVLLVVIGFTGLILELKVPGTTVPGIIAALCFILVFWAHTQFSGQVAVLAGLLFLLGIVLVLLEVFVFPGFGVTGILGVIFMLLSLALVTFNDIPTTWSDAGKIGGKMATYLIGMFVSVGFAFLIARYLPNIPYANRLILLPPSEQPGADSEPPVLPGAALAASLLGAVGTSMTVLRPAGSVRFGEQFIDVVSDGGYIPAGVRVQVIEVEGTRIVVKEV